MKDELETVIAGVVKSALNVDIEIELTRTEEQFGDYATNVALKLAKQLAKSPKEVAESLVPKIAETLGDKISEVSIAGPGFINLKLSDESLITAIKESPLSSPSLKDQVVVVEYSDPNPFKPLHAGHLYTTLVGDTISRLLSHAGAKVIRVNYGGDVGLHVGKSMWAIIKYLGGEFPDKLAAINESDRPNWLGERYVEGNKAYQEDENAKAEIVAVNKRVYELHNNNDHESDFAKLYYTGRDWSYAAFKELYNQLEVIPFDRYIAESEVTPIGLATVNEYLEKGVYSKSNGAVIFDGEKIGLHTRVFINSEGLPTYEAKDVGLSLLKWQDYNFNKSIIITANEQAEYMKVVMASLKQIVPEAVARTKHLTHGLIKLAGGTKMSSRTGNVVTANQIIETARLTGQESETKPNESTVLAAVKYALTKSRIGGDIIYDPKESIALDGNSGPYLQYAHARACSIIKKSGVSDSSNPTFSSSVTLQLGERSLVRKLVEFSEVIIQATDELMPHYICTYLYELSQIFNRFYENNKVIGDDRQELRLYLVSSYADSLKTGLNLLGMNAPDSM